MRHWNTNSLFIVLVVPQVISHKNPAFSQRIAGDGNIHNNKLLSADILARDGANPTLLLYPYWPQMLNISTFSQL